MKTKNIFLTVALALCTTFAFAQNTITASAHDFGDGELWNTSDEICITCHTPHNASALTVGAPLWNHVESTQTFVPYDNAGLSTTIQATDISVPSGTSKLCLSCHDGITDMADFGANTYAVTVMATAGKVLGLNLETHHPVSFTYNATLASADGGLHDPTSTASGLTGGLNIDDDLLFGTGNDQLECASCHDVHNNGEGLSVPSLLVKLNSRSALCLTCHNK